MTEAGDDRTDPDATKSHDPKSAGAQRIAGRYDLVEKLGEGGMGEVWAALQSEPVRRSVAIKLIKQGMDSQHVIARFEQERQALAMMDHPNIAKVLDGGLLGNGQPFFVMELVNGSPLTHFCDNAKLDIRQRLELFVPVCQAVQHAHQKGIIHRDLKPSNILVTVVDGKPTPKVIDFGVAKALKEKLTDETLSTQFGAFIGTLDYMPPEQAGMAMDDVDTRSDVYSLGAVLYELLTGLRPFDSKRLRQAARDEMVRIIREEEPPSLSSRLSTEKSLASIAAFRRVEPKRLLSQVKGELAWIVQRCLEKDRNRRYETANGLAREIQRYLADEPVEARPTSAAYRLRKLVRRHRGAVFAGALLIAALVLGVAGTSWQAYRATEAEADAKRQTAKAVRNERLAQERASEVEAEQVKTLNEKKRAEENERTAVKERQKADQEREIAVAVRRFLQDDLLGQGNPWRRHEAARKGAKAKGKSKPNPTIQELIDQAADRVIQPAFAKEFQQRPQVYAEIAATVADASQAIERYDRAIALFEAALKFSAKSPGMDESAVLSLRCRLAVVYFRAHRFDGVATELVQILAAVERNTGGAGGKFDVGVRQLDQLLAIVSEQLLNGPTVSTSEISVAQAPQLALGLLQATAIIDRVQKSIEAKQGRDDRRVQILRMINAFVAEFFGRKAEAVAIFEASMNGLEQSLGPFDMWTRLARMNVIRLRLQMGEGAKASALADGALAKLIARDGEGSYEVAELQVLQAECRNRLDRPTEAIGPLEKASRTMQDILGLDHPTTIYVLDALGGSYQQVGRFKDSVTVLELAKSGLAGGRTVPQNLEMSVNNDLATAYAKLGRNDDVTRHLAGLRDGYTKRHGQDHEHAIAATWSLAAWHDQLGRPNESLPLFEQALRAVEKGRFQHRFAEDILGDAALALENQRQFEKAERIRRTWVAEAKRKSGAGSTAYARSLAPLGLNLLAQKKWSESESVLRECLAIRSKAEADLWSTFNSRSALGGALLGQKKFAEAEPLLLDGYEGLNKRSAAIPPSSRRQRLAVAADRLVELYTATNKPDEIKKWKAERAKHDAPAPKTPAEVQRQ